MPGPPPSLRVANLLSPPLRPERSPSPSSPRWVAPVPQAGGPDNVDAWAQDEPRGRPRFAGPPPPLLSPSLPAGASASRPLATNFFSLPPLPPPPPEQASARPRVRERAPSRASGQVCETGPSSTTLNVDEAMAYEPLAQLRVVNVPVVRRPASVQIPSLADLDSCLQKVRKVAQDKLLLRLHSPQERLSHCKLGAIPELRMFFVTDAAFLRKLGKPHAIVGALDAVLMQISAHWPAFAEVADHFGWRPQTPPYKVMLALMELGRALTAHPPAPRGSATKLWAGREDPLMPSQQDGFALMALQQQTLPELIQADPFVSQDGLQPLLNEATIVASATTHDLLSRIRTLAGPGSTPLKPFGQSLRVPEELTFLYAPALLQLLPLQRQMLRELSDLAAGLRREIVEVGDLRMQSLLRLRPFNAVVQKPGEERSAALLPKNLPCPVFRHRLLPISSAYDVDRILRLQDTVLDLLEFSLDQVYRASKEMVATAPCLPVAAPGKRYRLADAHVIWR